MSQCWTAELATARKPRLDGQNTQTCMCVCEPEDADSVLKFQVRVDFSSWLLRIKKFTNCKKDIPTLIRLFHFSVCLCCSSVRRHHSSSVRIHHCLFLFQDLLIIWTNPKNVSRDFYHVASGTLNCAGHISVIQHILSGKQNFGQIEHWTDRILDR